MVEVRRDLYMDESTGERLLRFESIKDDLEDVLAALANIDLA
jgi:hypothetical protein